MRIVGFETKAVQVPKARGPLGDMPGGPLGTFVTVRVRTDEGIEGVSYAGWSGWSLSATKILNLALDELLGQVVGRDPLDGPALVRRLRAQNEIGTAAGIIMRASSTIDVALWDIRGKAFGVPCWKLLGGSSGTVPCYASGHFLPSYSLAEIDHWAKAVVDSGFRAMKMHARPDSGPEAPVERMRVLRAAVGPEPDIMVDCGQRLTVPEAIRLGRALDGERLSWLEDPVDHEDYAGLAEIARALDAPVCGGEFVHGLLPFGEMLRQRSVDILMIDLYRTGGFTGFMEAAHAAAAFNIPVASHLVPELNVHLVAAAPNALIAEHAPWGFPLWKAAPTVASGALTAPEGPGLGLEFDDEALARFAI